MKQAAMYVRVSTQQQKEEATIESQKALLHQFAKEKGFEIPDGWVFEDNGISGSTLARPALDRLRDLAYERLFDRIFILSPDRLSRKYAYQAILMEEFNRNNVSVTFQNSPNSKSPGDQLLLQMQGMFAEYERAQITERSRRGKKHKARNGNVSVLSHAPYGYRYIKGSEGCQAYFEIVDREAFVVKTIFDLYTRKRLSIAKIREYLCNHQIVTSTGKTEWSKSSIGNILKNSTYRGIAYFGMREKCEYDPMRLPSRSVRMNGRHAPRKAFRKRDPKEWIEIPVPAIVENNVFELSQELLEKNKRLSVRNANPGSLLQGLISCKECGYGFITCISGKKEMGHQYYRCCKRDKKCTNRGIRGKDLDEAIWNSLIFILESPDLIQKEVSRRLSDLEKEPFRQRQQYLEKQMLKLEEESNRLLDAYQNECIELPDLKQRMNIIKREKNNIIREMAEANSCLNKKQLLELTEAVKCFSDHLRSSHKTLKLEDKRKILRMLIKEIRVGNEDITVDHIIPVQKAVHGKTARLCLDREGD